MVPGSAELNLDTSDHFVDILIRYGKEGAATARDISPIARGQKLSPKITRNERELR